MTLQWNINFIRTIHDREVDFFILFFNLLYCIKLRRGGQYKLYWARSKIGMFEVISFCNALLPHDRKSTWRNKTLMNVDFFAWTATLEEILTMDNLRKLYIIVVDWCGMCKKSRKAVDHPFLHCETTSALWNSIFGLLVCWRGKNSVDIIVR